mgnify:CR=1 FL=1
MRLCTGCADGLRTPDREGRVYTFYLGAPWGNACSCFAETSFNCQLGPSGRFADQPIFEPERAGGSSADEPVIEPRPESDCSADLAAIGGKTGSRQRDASGALQSVRKSVSLQLRAQSIAGDWLVAKRKPRAL